MPKAKQESKIEKKLTLVEQRLEFIKNITTAMKGKQFGIICVQEDAKNGIKTNAMVHDVNSYKFAATVVSLIMGHVPAEKRMRFGMDVAVKAVEIANENDKN